MSTTQPLPPKKEVALALLERSSVYVHLDPRQPPVVVPPWFKKQPQLVLQIGLNMPVPIPDLEVTAEADGLIIGSKLYQDLAILDPTSWSWSLVTATGKTDGFNSEEGWALLPDGSFFTLDVENAPYSERFLLMGPTAGVWASAGTSSGQTMPRPSSPTRANTLDQGTTQ